MKRLKLNDLYRWKTKSSRKPLIVNGARQVGKTFLLKEFARDQFAKSHYINFEEQISLRKIFEQDLTPEVLLRDLALTLGTTINPETDLIIFDEVQACPRALTSLKYFAEKSRAYYLCAAGSLLGLALSDESFPVGLVDFLDLHPLSFVEFLLAFERHDLISCIESEDWSRQISPAVHEAIWNYLKIFITIGGLPEVVARYIEQSSNQAQALFNARETQKYLLGAYERDIAKHAGKINAMHIYRVFHSIAAQLGKNITDSVQRFRFRGVIPGAGNYQRLSGPIDWLQKAGLAYKVSIVEHSKIPLLSHAKENIFKLYLIDTGLLGAMAEISPQAMFDFSIGSYKGFLAENFVAQELITSGHSALFGWQQNDAEIEFLIHGTHEVVPIEVKSAAHFRARSFESYVKRYDPSVGYILSGKDTFRNLKEEKIIQMPLYRASYIPPYPN